MSLGALKVYGRAARGILNERFAAYVRWVVEEAGTKAMRLALADGDVIIQFWIHGKKVRRNQSGRAAYGHIRFRPRTFLGPSSVETFRKLGLKIPPGMLAPNDATHHAAWFRSEKGRPGLRYVIQIDPRVLADPYLLPHTIIHELKHLTDHVQGRLVGARWDEPRARNAEERVFRAITASELRRAYLEHFGDALANRVGRGVAQDDDALFTQVLRGKSIKAWLRDQDGTPDYHQPRVRKP